MSSARRTVAIGLLLLLATGACANEKRPSVDAWRPLWESTVALVPDQELVGEDPDQALCEATLAGLRTNRPTLDPTPDLAIDDPVRNWFQIAEDAFFECPPNNDRIGSFGEAYRELIRLEGEIDLVLTLDG